MCKGFRNAYAWFLCFHATLRLPFLSLFFIHGAVALELLRREASIWSAFTQSVHFPTPGQAEREFQRQSIRNRSKFERETCTSQLFIVWRNFANCWCVDKVVSCLFLTPRRFSNRS
jgi:Protein of unknown function (DUF1517)